MRQIIDNNPPDSKSGDTLYISFTKINEMTLELYNQDASFSGDLITINSILDTINDGTSVLNHQHTISQIIGLQTSLNSKVSTTTFNNEIASINASIVQINSTIQDILNELQNKIDDAPFSGITYGRNDGEWVEISGGTSTLQEVLDNNHDLVDGNNFQGTGAGFENYGINVNGLGSLAAKSNLGNYVNSFGNESCNFNEGNYVNAFGTKTGFNNIRNNVNLFGYNATADADNQTVFSKYISGTTKYLGRLSFNNITANIKWELPNNSGTLALLSDIPTGTTWGSITGSIADQNDLVNELQDRELITNKATGFTTVNNVLYPTVQAVEDRIDLIPIVDDNVFLTHYPVGSIITLNNYTSTVSNTTFSSNVSNSNNLTRFQPFVTNKSITIDELYLAISAGNNGASSTVTFYIFDDSNDGFPGVKLHQEISAVGALNVTNTILTFATNVVLQPGVYWIGIHIRDLNTGGANPSFYYASLGGNTKGIQTAAITYTNNFQGVLGSPANASDLTDNPTILVTSSTALSVPMLKIKIG